MCVPSVVPVVCEMFLQSCCLFSCIILLILFGGVSCGSMGFCFRTVFLVSMAALIFSGRSFCLLRILP